MSVVKKPQRCRIMWTAKTAAEFLHRLRSVASSAHFCVGLAGSVLFDGKSAHDLDVILFPLSTDMCDEKYLRYRLGTKLAMKVLHNEAVVRATWRSKGSKDEKRVEVWSYEGRRVDLFFLR